MKSFKKLYDQIKAERIEAERVQAPIARENLIRLIQQAHKDGLAHIVVPNKNVPYLIWRELVAANYNIITVDSNTLEISW